MGMQGSKLSKITWIGSVAFAGSNFMNVSRRSRTDSENYSHPRCSMKKIPSKRERGLCNWARLTGM